MPSINQQKARKCHRLDFKETVQSAMENAIHQPAEDTQVPPITFQGNVPVCRVLVLVVEVLVVNSAHAL
jgi:hypothetical protein